MKRSAFTLVELLIVMAVIAALISVVAPMGLNALKQARTVEVAGDYRGVMQEIIGLVAGRGKPIANTAINTNSYKTPFSIATTSAYVYTITASGTSFDKSKYDGNYLQGALENTRNSTIFSPDTFVLSFSVASYIYN
ncbi:MAG: type II secretion system protein [Thermotogaceae bacterium]|nr:type II secretion system protein [Thermotogaceae bacterium]